MWWSSPKSNSKIQHQKKSFLGKIYSIMALKLTWMGSNECALSTVEVFSSTICAHIYVSTEAVWRCPFPIYSAGPTYCFPSTVIFYDKIKKFLCVFLMYMGLLGSVSPDHWTVGINNNSLQLWNMTCTVTSTDHLGGGTVKKVQVVMHHMWWSSPKSNSKIHHQKKIMFRQNIQYYGTGNWHEWVPMSVLSTVEVFFTQQFCTYLRVHRSSMKVSIFQFIQRALHTASVDSIFSCKIRHFMCFNVHGAAG